MKRTLLYRIALIMTVVMVGVQMGAFAAINANVDYGSWSNPKQAAVATPTPTPTPFTIADMKDYYGVKIGEASTTFGVYASQANRNNNIKLAANFINNTIVQKNAVFSFNQTVGPRTVERGFKEATIFVGNEKEQGLGGGICQVSSTMYMAVKRTAMQIVERHQHSLPVSYCSSEDEATVSWGYLDFRFKNTSGDPIVITTNVTSGGRITIQIWQMLPRR